MNYVASFFSFVILQKTEMSSTVYFESVAEGVALGADVNRYINSSTTVKFTIEEFWLVVYL